MYEDRHDPITWTPRPLPSAGIPGQRKARPPASNPVRVRDATPGDYDAMRRVLTAAYARYDTDIPIDIYDTYLAGLLDFAEHAKYGELLVAERAGEVIGTAAFYPNAKRQLRSWRSGWAGGRALAVHPDARRLGAAHALLYECEHRARAVGAPAFAFHTMGFMSGAISLYERAGYRRAAEYDIEIATAYGLRTTDPFTIIAYVRELA